MNKCTPYERKTSKAFVGDIKRARELSISRLKAMNEFKVPQSQEPTSLEGKRASKYMEKFGYRAKLISNKCPSGKMMGTPAATDNKGSRLIHKYLKTDEVRCPQALWS